jgi:ABC-type transporter Mla MlaB component
MSAPDLTATGQPTAPAAGGAWRADLAGELNIPVAAERLPELQALAAACPPGAACEIDVGRITEVDSAGVQLLLALRRSLARQGSPLALTSVRTALAQALATYRLDDTLAPLDIDTSLADEFGADWAGPALSASPALAGVTP